MKKNMNKRLHIVLWAVFVLGLIGGCGWNDLAMGGGDATETGNARVAGHLVLEDGKAAADAEVVILDSSYNPISDPAIPDSQRVRTDSKGIFHFTRLDSGIYNIQVKHAGTHTTLLILSVKVDQEKVRLAQDTLRLSGSLSIPIPETGDSGLGYIYLPGTTLRSRIDSEIRVAGKIQMDSVPAVVIPSVIYTKGDANSSKVSVCRNIAVKKSEVMMVPPFFDWSHSASIQLNTSATGVPISKNLYGFPMLIRLTAPKFNFAQAQADGKDLRFAKADGTPLVREIEAWDALAGHAEIWVRMDSVQAGAANQEITMHWGNTKAISPSRPFNVFDTANGFGGVWHLGEEAKDTTTNGLYRDATGRGNHGNDRVTSTRLDGVIANGHGLDSGDYIEAPILTKGIANPNAYTISIWYRSRINNGLSANELISMGDNFGLRLKSDGTMHHFFWPPTQPPGISTPWWYVEMTNPKFVDGNWHLAAGIYDGSYLRIFVDGQEVAINPVLGPVAFKFAFNLSLGRHGHLQKGLEFAGDLDEAQIHSVARPQDWMRLSYENQKPGASFPKLILP
jgi:hypothetical protein